MSSSIDIESGGADEDGIPLALRMLSALLEAHGVTGPFVRDWILPFERQPCITADWLRRDPLMGTLAIVVHLEDGREVVEVFPGIGGDDREAIGYALESFVSGALHEMLAAIWSVREE